MTIPVHLDLSASASTFRDLTFEFHEDGIRGWKILDDRERYHYAILESRPEVLVECGTKFGGSALWFAQRVPRVITIDIDGAASAAAREKSPPNVTWLIGSSVDPALVKRVQYMVRERRVMVSLDSNHMAPHVCREIDAYGPLVSSGSYLVVEDGIFDLMGREGDRLVGEPVTRIGGALKAIEAKLVNNPQWTRDEEVEKMSDITHSPAGWWKRA